MNLNLIQSKLSEMNTPKGGSQKSSEKALSFWKPTVGKALVRFVPSNRNPENPFTELHFHYGIGKRTIISPTNFGEKDPIIEFAKELRKTKEPENWKLAKKLEPKMRCYVPIVVRGKESEGVKFWGFGKTVYTELLGFMADDDYCDISDPMNGRDIVVEFIPAEGAGYPKTTIRIKLKIHDLLRLAETQ